MSSSTTISNLLEDISLEQQQLLAGGRSDAGGTSAAGGTSDEDGDEDNKSSNRFLAVGESRSYRVRKFSVISVRRLS